MRRPPRRPCTTRECRDYANAAGVYCDRCDTGKGIAGWSRTRDDAWLAYVDCDGISEIPLPTGMDYKAASAAIAAPTRTTAKTTRPDQVDGGKK